MRIILLTTFLCVLNLHFYAQTTNAFRVNYDQALLDLPGNTTESLTPNQYVFAGSAVNFIPVYGTVTELDNAGNLLWSKRYYDGSFGFQINDVKKDQASNEYFVCGGSDLNDGVFMRLDANGNIVMSARFGIDEADGAFLSRIIKTSDGNYLAAGYVTGHNPDGAGPEEYFEPITYTDNNGDQQTEYFHSPLLVKFDPSGNAIWHHVARYYKTATADPNDRIYNDAYFRDIVEVADGYMAVGSYKVNDHLSSTNNDGDDNTPTDATIFKTDFNGNITFHKQVDNPNTDPSQNSKYLSAINKTSAGDPIAGGYTNQRELVMKYGATGGFSLTFSRRFEYSSSFLGGTDPVDISQIYEADGSTDIVTMGMYIRPLSFEFNNSIHRMNASATSTNWAKKYSLGGPTILPRGQQVSDGGFLMSSTTMGTSFDYQIIKTDPDGETPINDCEAENFSPSASSGPTTIADPYYKTWQGTTGPTTLNLSVDNINPAPNFICQHSPCTPPPLADDVTATEDPICAGESTTINASGSATGVSYNVYDAPSGGNNLGSAPHTVSPATTTTYYVETVDDADPNCVSTSRVPIEITVNEGPDLSLSSEDVSCFGESDGEASVVATGNNPFTYSWSPGGQSTDNITNLPEGNYSVTVEDNNGCSSSESIQVNEPDEIELTFNTVDAECNVENGSAEVIASGGAGGFTYSWSPGGETTNEITDIGAGVYEVTVTDGTTCSVTESVSVNSSNAPEITVESITHVSCNGENDGSVEVSVTGGTSPYSYQWSPSGGNSQLEEDLSAGTYEVTVTDDDDCPAVLEVVIEEPDEIQLDGTTSDAFCGNLDGSINLEVTGGAEPYTYDWVDEDVSGQNPTDLPPGEYEVTVIDDNGCISTDIFNVDVTGDIPFNVNPQIVTIENGESTQLEVIIGNGVTGENYEWSPTDGLSCISCPNPMASPSETTTYTVTVSTDDGCVSSDTILVIVEDACSDVFIPNIFSPNDDNNNDYLCVEGTCIASINLSIYNRWGEKVFETKDPNECWDGTYKGERLNTGVFAYKALITTVDGQELDKSGNLTLVK